MKFVIVLVFVAATCGLGQITQGFAAVDGTVRDESGAFVAGAKVTLIEQSKGLARETKSDSGGAFLLPALIAGVYSVSVEKPGFRSEQMRNLNIEVGAQASITVRLHVGEMRTTVTVAPPTTTELDAESNTLGSVVNSAEVQELPLNGRNFLQLGLLAAPAVDNSPASNIFSSNVGPPARTIVLPGTLPSTVGYSLDGLNIRGSRDGELALSPSVAAIDQFKVQESFLMPDQGIYPAAVNTVTKSGTNELHGEAFEFLRNRSLDARSFFAASPEDVKLNQFGFSLGGPLRKDHVWSYGFYEGLRELTAFSTAGYSPTAEMFNGNFAADAHTIYNPATYDPASGTRQPFPGNTIPLSQINPVSKNLLNYYIPGSSLSSVPNNVQGNPRDTLNSDQGGLRLDADLNARHQLFAQIFEQNAPSDQPGLYPLSGLLYQNESELALIEDVWIISALTTNTLRVGFLRAIAVGGNEAQGLGPNLPAIGISNTFQQSGITAINLQGYSSFGRSNGDVGNRDNSWQFSDEFTYIRGRHTLALGAQLLYRRGWHLNGNSLALGSLSFQPIFTAQLARNAQGQSSPLPITGDSFADFLLGDPTTGVLLGLPVVQFRGMEFLPFFQDTWRVASNLTLNFGLSWFLETPPNPQGWAQDAVHGFDTSTGLLTYAALGQINSQVLQTDKDNFAPRLGLAWRPGSLRNTVIRAGVGSYYSEFPWLLAPYPLEGGSPMVAGVSLTNSAANPFPTYALGLNVFPPRPAGNLTSTYAANLPPGTVISALNPAFRTAYVNQWNLSVQHSLSQNDSVALDYLGASGHRLPNVFDLSQCRTTTNLFCSPAARPWPQYGLILYGDSSGNSSYEALVAKYEHRMTSGLDLRVEYAFGKALTDTWQSSLSIYNQISDCRVCSKGPATFDVRHRFVGSVVWQLPFGRGQRFGRNAAGWVDVVAGGWTFTGITTFSSGEPIQLAAPNQTGSVQINPLPNRGCNGGSDSLSDNIRSNGFLWFDTACFTVPPVGFFGNSGPTVVAGPGVNNWDIGIDKNFRLARDTNKLQLRAEMFNAWNHTQFEPPNGNAGAGANFGRISAALAPRLIQVAAKIYW